MNIHRRILLATAGTSALVLMAAACGTSGGSNTDKQNLSGRGPITYVEGKDVTGEMKNIIAQWNAAHPKEKVTYKEQSEDADQQHSDLVQHFKAHDPNYDVTSVDVVWTSEFAAKGWLQPLEGKFAIDTNNLVKVAVDTATYRGKLFAAPGTLDSGILYYRKDLVPTPPKTWSELLADCKIAKKHNIGCYAGQFAKYEGLTVNVSEAINAAGGTFVKPDGKTAAVDTPQAAQGLQFLADAYKNGQIPKEAITYQEEQGRQAFEAGKLLFLRNWSYVYDLANHDGSSKVKGKFAGAPEPGPNGIGASTLGGHNMGISTFSKHKATALDFIKFYESKEIQRRLVEKAIGAPVLQSLYSDPTLLAEPDLGYLKTFAASLASAKSRPVTPFYPGVTEAIQDNSYAAIKGDKSVSQALKDMQAAITSATQGH